jgi:hypothetical protein
VDLDGSLGVLAAGADIVEAGEHTSVFHRATGTALSLNRTAADLVALADGTTTLRQAVGTLARAYDVPADAIAGSVLEAVAQLRQMGTLVDAPRG